MQPKMEKLYTVSKNKTRTDCGSDHELLIAKFRLKLKKVGKTTNPSRHEINQIPYDYTVELTNRFKGLDLIECLKNHGRRSMTLYRRQGSRPSPRKRNAKAKWLSEEALQIAVKTREVKSKGEKERSERRVAKNSKESCGPEGPTSLVHHLAPATLTLPGPREPEVQCLRDLLQSHSW